MKVKAKYEFEFLPDTSDLDENNVDKKGLAEEFTKLEIQDMLDKKQISAEDFEFDIEDDNDDHALPEFNDEIAIESPIYQLHEDPYKAASPIMKEFVTKSAELVKDKNEEYSEHFLRALVEAVNSDLSWEILGRDIFD